MRRTHNKNFWHWVRTHKRIAGVAAGIVVVGGYVSLSVVSWQQYQTQYESSVAKTKIAIDAALALPQEMTEEKNQKIASLHETVGEADTIDCGVNFMFDWQRMFGHVQARVNGCVNKAEKMLAMQDALSKTATYLKDEQALVAKMATNTTSAQVQEDAFEGQASAWQRVQSDVASLEVDETFKPVKIKAQEAADAIYEAWQRLFDAHKAEDQSAYEEARAKLPESYDRLAAIAPVADTQLAELTKALESAYNSLFS